MFCYVTLILCIGKLRLAGTPRDHLAQTFIGMETKSWRGKVTCPRSDPINERSKTLVIFTHSSLCSDLCCCRDQWSLCQSSWKRLGHRVRRLSSKESTCQCRRHRRHGFNPWVGKIPWRSKWQPISVFLLGNPMDRGAWRATVLGISKSHTQLSDWTQCTV